MLGQVRKMLLGCALSVVILLSGGGAPWLSAREVDVDAAHRELPKARALMHAGDTSRDEAERRRRYAEAQRIADSAIESKPDDPAAVALLALLEARALRDANIFRQALMLPALRRTLDRALALAPDDGELLDAKGTLLLRLPSFSGGNPRIARELFEHAVEVDPSDTTAYLGLAEAAQELDDLPAAAAAATRAAELARAQGDNDDLARAQARLRTIDATSDTTSRNGTSPSGHEALRTSGRP
jgi:tetratricopeptide (TPR) repeat protein